MEKYIVHDLTKEVPDSEFDTKEQAQYWINHLWQWRPHSRPEIQIKTIKENE